MEQSSEIVIFFGRFHPLLLHLPIGFLALGFLMEILSRREQFAYLKPAIGFVLGLGAISAFGTAILGLMLAQAGDYGEDLLFVHQWAGILLVLFAFGTWWLYLQKEKKATVKLRKAYLGSLSLMMVFLGVAGHYGGSLTHGSNYLTQYMPNGLKKLAGMPVEEKGPKLIENLDEAVVYTDIIHPIMEIRCNSCHNSDKKKGDLQMHTREALLKGGENGPIFEAGNAAESEMIKRIHLDQNHDDHMPPKGKSQLSDEQVLLLEWWINEGAPFDKKVAELQADQEVQSVLLTLADPNANKTAVEILLAEGTVVPDEEKLNAYVKEGIAIKPLSNDANWLQVTLYKNDPVDEVLNRLAADFPEQVTWLDVKDTPLTDEGLAAIGKFKNLTRLRAEKTDISDAGLAHLKDLQYLESLNIYGTSVTDEGLASLENLENLRRLYAWDTQVSKEGAARLQEAATQLDINLGYEVEVIDSLTVKVLPVANQE
ncbi:c-type cytochrome domain-containing protein [Cyclobacterium sp. SYSU L10401]|uniref:c-type cytochrome domain-containing protein n=1 Tax=Cyclobacterium sp. SYSU L10401 TaxID=2678657 RepID=UPI0013D3F528|nr:c-type cytochrome domain-containing protein [Cyclobacterium sp. SYSU L10401]